MKTWRFIGLAFAISWACWIPAALTGQNHTEFPTVLLYALGGFGPSLAGIWMVYRAEPRTSRKDFWRRVWDPRRISAASWLVIFLLVPTLLILGILAAFLSGQQGAGFSGLRPVLASLVLILPALLTGLIGGPLSEELGWRGYALDQLQRRMQPLAATLLLALVWAFWHLPLFFIRGTLQSQMQVGSLFFWNFWITAFGLAVMMTWVYNRSRRSILAAILMHFTFNLVISQAFPLSQTADIAKTALFVIAGVAFAFTLSAPPEPPEERV